MAVHHFTAPSFIAGWKPIASCPYGGKDVELMDENTGITIVYAWLKGVNYTTADGKTFIPTHWRTLEE